MRIIVVIFLAVVAAVLLSKAAPVQPTSDLLLRSQLSMGNLARLQHVMAKSQKGDPVTIGFIGGSITFGERATASDRQFADRATAWWGDRFPQSKITLVNAGVPGTGSNYGCLRAGRDLLSHHPDLVVAEFGVNDRDDMAHAQTYEGLIRQILGDPQNPAVVLLFMMHHDGTNAQVMQGEVGRNYQLPMVSFRDAVWPRIAQEQMKVEDVLADTVHPNDRGHHMIAACITHLFENALTAKPDQEVSELAKPRFSDLFAHTKLIQANSLKPICAQGWSFDIKKNAWVASAPGSVIDFEIPGRVIDLLYNRATTAGGTAIVSVDGGSPVLCDAWFDGTWAGHCQTDVVGTDLSPGMHRVRIELSSQQNALSNGHAFEILGLGSAGN